MPRKLNVLLPLTGAIILVAVAWTCRNTLYDAPMVYQAQSLEADLSVPPLVVLHDSEPSADAVRELSPEGHNHEDGDAQHEDAARSTATIVKSAIGHDFSCRSNVRLECGSLRVQQYPYLDQDDCMAACDSMFEAGCNAFEMMAEHTETEASTPVHAQCTFLRCSGPSASPRPVTNPELIGKLQSCIREDFLAQLKNNGQVKHSQHGDSKHGHAEREHNDKAVKTDREGAQKNEVSAENEGRNHEGKPDEDQDDKKKDKQGHDLHGKEHARPTVEPSEDTVLELEKDEPQAPEVDGKTAGLSCPGSVRYGYDKLKAQGGCSAKENSTIGAFEEFAVVYHWVRIREGIECSFTLNSPTHVYTLQVDNFNRPHPQLDIPPSDAKYTLQRCFSRADQLDQHQNPWQGRMGLKELDFRELDERRAWAADQPMPTLQELAAMPDEFDARKRWPQCGWLNSPKDQLECGSCWAMSTALVLSTSLCAMTNQTHNVEISPQDMISCTVNDGCSGGHPACAFWFAGYNPLNKYKGPSWCPAPPESRRPFLTSPCDPYEAKDHTGGAMCNDHCKTPNAIRYAVNLSSIGWATNEFQMKQAILKRGAIVSCFNMYSDFYTGGVYSKGRGAEERGGHAVATIGWGTDNGVDYWLAENSWGPTWGENGYFRIRRGTDECQFESFGCGNYADIVVPSGPPPISCLNGGTVNADGKSCNCRFGSSGTNCKTCAPCENGGKRSSHWCDCDCPVGTFGTLCQQKLKVSCGAVEVSVSVSTKAAGATKDLNAPEFQSGDYLLLLDLNNSTEGFYDKMSLSNCDSSAAFMQVGGVGQENSYKKYMCGPYKKGVNCKPKFRVSLGPHAGDGNWTVCVFRYLGTNEFGMDKGYETTGSAVGTCFENSPMKAPEAPTLSPTLTPSRRPTSTPTLEPSRRPTSTPTLEPSRRPTLEFTQPSKTQAKKMKGKG